MMNGPFLITSSTRGAYSFGSTILPTRKKFFDARSLTYENKKICEFKRSSIAIVDKCRIENRQSLIGVANKKGGRNAKGMDES